MAQHVSGERQGTMYLSFSVSLSLSLSLCLSHTHTLTWKISHTDPRLLTTWRDAARSSGISRITEVLQILRPSGFNIQLLEDCVLRQLATMATEGSFAICVEGKPQGPMPLFWFSSCISVTRKHDKNYLEAVQLIWASYFGGLSKWKVILFVPHSCWGSTSWGEGIG